VRVPRLLGVYTAGQIINPKTARSQLLGGMTWGLSMALHEHSVLDPRFGHVTNGDFAGYHIAANADVGTIEVHTRREEDPYVNPMGSKGIGELGIVGAAAAIANATYHATQLSWLAATTSNISSVKVANCRSHWSSSSARLWLISPLRGLGSLGCGAAIANRYRWASGPSLRREEASYPGTRWGSSTLGAVHPGANP